MRRRGWRGALALLCCLVLAGLIRAAIPQYVTQEYLVRADADGVASSDEVTVRFRGVEQGSAAVLDTGWGETRTETGETLVVVHLDVTAHQKTFTVNAQLRTADGYTYDYLNLLGVPGAQHAYVGFTHTTSYLFELPPDKVEGAWLAVHGSRPDGLMPVIPVLRFELPDEIPQSGEITLVPDEEGPVR